MMLRVCPLACVLLVGCDNARFGPTHHETFSYPLTNTERLHADLRLGAGELKVTGGAGELADLDITSSMTDLKQAMHFRPGTSADLEVGQPDLHGGDSERWSVQLSDKVLTDIFAKIGAGQVTMNLGSMQLRTVELEMGAGEVKVDLRGNPKRSYDVHIQGGAGEATVYLPKSVGIIARASGGIGDIQTSGLVEHNGRWINPGQENSPVTIHVDVKGGVGSIHLEAE